MTMLELDLCNVQGKLFQLAATSGYDPVAFVDLTPAAVSAGSPVPQAQRDRIAAAQSVRRKSDFNRFIV